MAGHLSMTNSTVENYVGKMLNSGNLLQIEMHRFHSMQTRNYGFIFQQDVPYLIFVFHYAVFYKTRKFDKSRDYYNRELIESQISFTAAWPYANFY